MQVSPGHVETELIDLTEVSLSMLGGCDEKVLAPSLQRMMRQLDQARGNIGTGGPPGRAD